MVHCISISILCFTGVGFFITTIILWFAAVVLCCFIGFLFINIVILYFKGVLFIRIGILFFKGVLFISNVILYFIRVVFCLSRLVIFTIFSSWYLKDITVCLEYYLYTEDQVGTENLQSLILNLYSLISRSIDMFCIDNDYLGE